MLFWCLYASTDKGEKHKWRIHGKIQVTVKDSKKSVYENNTRIIVDNHTSSLLRHHLYRFLLYGAKKKVILKSSPNKWWQDNSF